VPTNKHVLPASPFLNIDGFALRWRKDAEPIPSPRPEPQVALPPFQTMVSSRPSDAHQKRKTQFIDLANLLPPRDQQELQRWIQKNHRDRRRIAFKLRRGRSQNNPQIPEQSTANGTIHSQRNNPQTIGKLSCKQGVDALPHTDEPSSLVDLNRHLRLLTNRVAASTMHIVGSKDACPIGIKAG
jgi:hypothetical protein